MQVNHRTYHTRISIHDTNDLFGWWLEDTDLFKDAFAYVISVLIRTGNREAPELLEIGGHLWCLYDFAFRKHDEEAAAEQARCRAHREARQEARRAAKRAAGEARQRAASANFSLNHFHGITTMPAPKL